MSTSGISDTSGLLSEQLINTAGGLTSGSTLTNSGAGSTLQLTGLASGINTTELIQSELAEQEQPLENMQEEISSLNTENSTLQSIEESLQNVSLDALTLGEPSTYFPVQNVTSSNDNLVTAATTNGIGAVIGSTTVTVTALASAAQTSFAYTPGTGSGENTLTFTVGSAAPTTIQVADNATADQVAEAIDGASDLGVLATVDSSGNLILSSQATGTGNLVSATLTDASGSTATLTQGTQQDGTDATFYLNGSTTASTSPSDTVTDAIPGVTLTLLGVTGSTSTDNPITITTAAPGPNTSAIVQSVQQFVTDYNNAINAIEAEVNTAPTSESTPSDYSPYSGSLFGDDQLENMLSDLRTTLDQSFSGTGISSTMDSLDEIGISTGESTGSVNTSSVDGDLTVDTSQLEAAIQSNPDGVQALMQQWSTAFQSIANAYSSPTGTLADRINGNDTIVTSLTNQLSSQETLYNTEEQNLEAQWAQVESTLETLDNQKTSLSSFTSGLSTSSSSSS